MLQMDGQTDRWTDGRTGERNEPTTSTAFAKATWVITFIDNIMDVNS